MSLKKLCDRILSYVQNKHISFNLYLKKKKEKEKKDIAIVFILIRI